MSESPRPEPEDAEPITKLVNEVFLLADALAREGDAIVAPFELSAARWLILGAMQDGPLSMAAIARRRGLTRQSVRESAARLEKSGLLVREPDPADARAPLLRLTPRGQATLREIEPARRRWAQHAAAGLVEGDIDATVDLLRRLRGKFPTLT